MSEHISGKSSVLYQDIIHKKKYIRIILQMSNSLIFDRSHFKDS
jgi:hypothetical protein